MSQMYLGMMLPFAGTFAPRGWALCQGQLMPIAQNAALYSILGTTYGGDGVTTYGIPDLRGRSPIGTGTGPGLGSYVLGQLGGTETVLLTAGQMPQHTHNVTVSGGDATVQNPSNAVLAIGGAYAPAGSPSGNAAASFNQTAGSNQPHSNLSPYLALNWIICIQGFYPSRN